MNGNTHMSSIVIYFPAGTTLPGGTLHAWKSGFYL